MAVTLTYRKRNYSGRYKMCILKYAYGNLDVTINVTALQTNMKQIYGITTSPPSVATKYVSAIAVSGGAATITVIDPTAAAYLYVIAWGI
jgi:hypothetical protein